MKWTFALAALVLLVAGCGPDQHGVVHDADDVIGAVVFWLVFIGVGLTYLALSKDKHPPRSSERDAPPETNNPPTPAAKNEEFGFGALLIGFVLLALGLLLGKWWLGL